MKAPPQASRHVASATERGPAREAEEYLADVEKAAPGFGGYYADEKGLVHVWSTSPEQGAKAVEVVREQFRSGRMMGSGGRVPPIVVDRGRFAFSQLSAWRDQVLRYALEDKGAPVRAIDADEAANRVHVWVEGDTASARKSITSLGVDADAIVIQRFEPMIEASGTRRAATTKKAMVPGNIVSVASPLVGGVGINWTYSGLSAPCTLGFLARLSGTTRFVTASHCTGNKYSGPDGTTINQPEAGSPLIGTELFDPGPTPCTAYYVSWFNCRSSDASLFSLAFGVSAEVGLLARTQVRNAGGVSGGTTTLDWDQFNPYWVIDAVDQNNLYVGIPIDKLGRKTGWTWGNLNNTCFDYIPGSNEQGGVQPVLCAYKVDAVTDRGDSGGPVFYIHAEGDSRVTLAGITTGKWYGNMVFSKYSSIALDLGTGLDAKRLVTLGSANVSGNLAGVVPNVTWPSVVGATCYRVYRQWYRYSNGAGSNGWELFIANTNSFSDPNLSADAYSGATTPGFNTEGYIKYQVRPMSATESGGSSNIVNFRLSP